MKTVVYELNEVPKKIFDFYAKAFPKSAFGKLRRNSTLFETHTADVGSLSPWVTWPTMHRGVSNVDHTISDLGQDLRPINVEFPPIWEILAAAGLRVGMFGSLQSYPMPDCLDSYEFYVPDTFAVGNECYPALLNNFQAFNLSMVKSNGRNVSSGIAWKEATNFMLNSIKLGLTPSTAKNLVIQVVNERLNKDRLVRRRSSQIEIAFDLFFSQLSKKKPDISFFFTNHLASSMHRYWPTIFPQDYDLGKFDTEWLARWKGEIPHAVKVANNQLDRLMNFCDSVGFKLIVGSSMGQHAVHKTTHVTSQALITNVGQLLLYLGIPREQWRARMAMAPQVVIELLNQDFQKNLKNLEEISINNKKITTFVTSTGDIRLELKLDNPDFLDVYHGSTKIDPSQIGVSRVDIQDAAGANAYHIPQGILLNYDPTINLINTIEREWREVSVLDFAPSLLKQYSIPKKAYMVGDASLFK